MRSPGIITLSLWTKDPYDAYEGPTQNSPRTNLPQIIFTLEPTAEPKKIPRTYQERFEDLKTAKRALSGL
jgi:hypothetical protein